MSLTKLNISCTAGSFSLCVLQLDTGDSTKVDICDRCLTILQIISLHLKPSILQWTYDFGLFKYWIHLM